MNDVINYLGLADPEIIKKNLKRNYFVIKGRMNKQDVLLKIASKDDTEGVKRLYKEKLIGDFIKEDIAEVLDFGQNKKYAWIVRRYHPGRPLANNPTAKTPLFSHKIRPEYLKNRREIISQITSNLVAIRNIVRKKIFFKRFTEDLSSCHIDLIEKKLGLDLCQQVNFYNSIKKRYFSDAKASISDLIPANIIVQTNGKVIFSDLEWFCFDNYTIDIATLWLFLWRDPAWQKELIKQNIRTKKDKDYFRASLTRIIIHLCDLTTMQIRDITPERFSERINKLKKHIWTKYLIAAGQSYTAIMKI